MSVTQKKNTQNVYYFLPLIGANFDVKTLKEIGVIRPCFCVFDILLYNDQILTNKPLIERLKYLNGMFKTHEGVLMNTERKEVTNREAVINELNEAIDNRLEGIVLKDPTSIYKPNTRKGGWYKIKPEVSNDFKLTVRIED